LNAQSTPPRLRGCSNCRTPFFYVTKKRNVHVASIGTVPNSFFNGSVNAIGRLYTSVRPTFCGLSAIDARVFKANQRWKMMNRSMTIALSMLAGAALGTAVTQGLHAQGKPKAYTISETEPLDAAAQAAYTPLVQAAQKAAPGNPRNLQTAGGRIVAIEGTPPKRIAITEWDSLDQAQAFYNSKAFKDLDPQRNKAAKTIRRYVVEATK
jgi:uncharacterized protein (DUF1330 family)